jgi:hypothetical protein
MNILGRLVGGLLILIGLGWLASTAGLPPFGDRRTANQLSNQKQGVLPTTKTATNNLTTPQKVTKTTTTTTAPAAVGTTSDAGKTTSTTSTTSTAPVEASPRDATAQPLTTQPNPQPATTTTVVVEQPTAPAAVPAGW